MMPMKQERSPDKPGCDKYIRVCADCGKDMHWEWGGEIAYFQCVGCQRIEPCANIIIKPKEHTVTIEDGNAKKVFAYSPEQFEEVLRLAIPCK